jgi:hypothetical protein
MGRPFIAYLAAHRLVAFLAIFSLSFAIRFSILIYVPRPEMLQSAEASLIANAIASKGQFADPFAVPTGPTAHLTPFYPVLLAGINQVFGTGYTGSFVRCLLVIGIYSLLYSLYPTFASIFGFPVSAGLFAGFLSALLPVKRSAEVFRGWEEPYAAIALALLLALTLKRWGGENRNPRVVLACGAAWGLAFYISFSLAPILFGLVVLDLFTRRSWTALRDSMLLVFAALAIMSPWLIRNRVELHGWTLMRTGLGQNLHGSNHDGVRAAAELINKDKTSRQMYPYNSVVEARKVQSMGELAYDRYQSRLAFDWIYHHRGKFAVLTLQRFIYFWAGPIEHPPEFAITTGYTLLGLIGLPLIKKRVGTQQFCLWCVALAMFPLIYYIVQGTNRYRVPIDWMVWLSAGLAITAVLEKLFPAPSPPGKDQVSARSVIEKRSLAPSAVRSPSRRCGAGAVSYGRDGGRSKLSITIMMNSEGAWPASGAP